AEADAHLARGHGHHDWREDLPVAGSPHAREGDQREVRAVEHQLEAQQDHERVAPRHHAERAEREDDRGDREVPGDIHRGGPTPSAIVPLEGGSGSSSGASPASGSAASSAPPRPPPWRPARTTAPTAAMSSRNEATSNTTRKRVSRSLPI